MKFFCDFWLAKGNTIVLHITNYIVSSSKAQTNYKCITNYTVPSSKAQTNYKQKCVPFHHVCCTFIQHHQEITFLEFGRHYANVYVSIYSMEFNSECCIYSAYKYSEMMYYFSSGPFLVKRLDIIVIMLLFFL